MEKNNIILKKKFNKHFYISPPKAKFHGFNFLITNIKNFGLKKNKLSINKLLNSSKYMLRNNSDYQSCFDHSRNIHFYPYKPQFSAKNSYKKNIKFLSSSTETKAILSPKILFKDSTIEDSKTNFISRKKFSTPASPISNRKKNFLSPKANSDDIYLNYNFKKLHNEFLKNYKAIENINEYDFNFLNDSLRNTLDKNFFLNNEYLEKVSTYNFDTLTIKVKLTGLCFKFYELSKHRKTSILNLKNMKGKKISTIKFPFEFLSFFYGINLESFLVFLTKVIDYNVSKNSFELNYEKFFENYNNYRASFFFYSIDSFIEKYDINNIKEYYKYNWDVSVDNEVKNIKNCILKIILPKMHISIENNFGKKYIFYSNIEINKLCYFLKNNFLDWDKYILIYFSEFKIFRFAKNNLLSADIDYKKEKKMRYNLNKTNTILNNIKSNNKSYEFLFTKFTNNEGNSEKENYFYQIKLPKINVFYRDIYTSLTRQFDLDINTLSKLNKLRKSFNKIDIIKYCLVFIKGRGNPNTNSNKLSKNSSAKKLNSYLLRNNSGKVLSKFSLRSGQLENIRQFVKGSDNTKDDVIDIKLNLNENIFNFDKDILKYIKADEEKQDNKNTNYKEYYNRNMHSSLHLNDRNILEDNMQKKLNIEIGKISLEWVSGNSREKKIYQFEENESEYLFDYSSNIWRDFIEKNFERIMSSSLYEKQLFTPSVKKSHSSIRSTKTIK